jgi:hypothetical protein
LQPWAQHLHTQGYMQMLCTRELNQPPHASWPNSSDTPMPWLPCVIDLDLFFTSSYITRGSHGMCVLGELRRDAGDSVLLQLSNITHRPRRLIATVCQHPETSNAAVPAARTWRV